jgi:hypothetical protein
MPVFDSESGGVAVVHISVGNAAFAAGGADFEILGVFTGAVVLGGGGFGFGFDCGGGFVEDAGFGGKLGHLPPGFHVYFRHGDVKPPWFGLPV